MQYAITKRSNPKQPSCKNRCGPKGHFEKNVRYKVAPRNGCDGRLMAKILITTIQVNLVPNPSKMLREGNTNLPELL